jgi:integrase
MRAMGRRRKHNLELPPSMYAKARGGALRYYYGKQGIALGDDFAAALRRYAELHGGRAPAGTVAEAIKLYRRDALPGKAKKTQDEYDRQLTTLATVFGAFRLDQVRPKHVQAFFDERRRPTVDAKGKPKGGPITATREKAVLSAVFNFARRVGLTDAPNPCAGVFGVKARRDRYVEHDELATAIGAADPILAGFLELCYLTGQRPGDVVRMRRQDVQDGVLRVQQGKTGAKVRIAVVGPLAAVLERLTTGAVGSVFLIRDEAGQPFTLAALRKRFKRHGFDWQIRDLRAKAGSDSDTNRDAQRLLGHAAATTTDGYIRQRAGERATPIMRKAGK